MLKSHNGLIVALAWLLAVPLLADEPTVASTVNDEAATESALGARVFIDEATGKVRSPSAAETAAMSEQFRRRFIDLSVDNPPTYHADGSISKTLGPSTHMYTVARIADDGKLEAQCLPVEQAAEFLANEAEEAPEKQADGDTSQ